MVIVGLAIFPRATGKNWTIERFFLPESYLKRTLINTGKKKIAITKAVIAFGSQNATQILVYCALCITLWIEVNIFSGTLAVGNV